MTLSFQKVHVYGRLRGVTTLSWEEMRIAGYPGREPPIDVCAGID